MGLFNIFKKKEAPAELPSLSLDQPQALNSPRVDAFSSQLNRMSVPQASEKREENIAKYKPLPVQKMEVWNSMHEVKSWSEKQHTVDEKGFFKELIKDLTKEISSEKLDVKYKEKILGDDIVTQMKSYWEKQKPEVFLENAGKEVKEQLMKKAENLTELEKDWQNAYFSLIAKEEKIRQEEKELKQMLSELIGIYEKSLSRRVGLPKSESKKSSKN